VMLAEHEEFVRAEAERTKQLEEEAKLEAEMQRVEVAEAKAEALAVAERAEAEMKAHEAALAAAHAQVETQVAVALAEHEADSEERATVAVVTKLQARRRGAIARKRTGLDCFQSLDPATLARREVLSHLVLISDSLTPAELTAFASVPSLSWSSTKSTTYR
jgi:hypothetical protein